MALPDVAPRPPQRHSSPRSLLLNCLVISADWPVECAGKALIPRHAGPRLTTHDQQLKEGRQMTADESYEQQEAELAASEAAQIGGLAGDEDLDPAQRAVLEAGGGEAEGFEDAEAALIDHASHGDQEPAHVILHDQGIDEEQNLRHEDSEADQARSSELDEDDR